VWPAPTRGGHINHDSLKLQHKKALRLSKVRAFEVYSIRHTFLTAWVSQGAMCGRSPTLPDHSSIAISARYVHPSSGAALNALMRFGQSQEMLRGHNSGHSSEMPDPLSQPERLLSHTGKVS